MAGRRDEHIFCVFFSNYSLRTAYVQPLYYAYNLALMASIMLSGLLMDRFDRAALILPRVCGPALVAVLVILNFMWNWFFMLLSAVLLGVVICAQMHRMKNMFPERHYLKLAVGCMLACIVTVPAVIAVPVLVEHGWLLLAGFALLSTVEIFFVLPDKAERVSIAFRKPPPGYVVFVALLAVFYIIDIAMHTDMLRFLATSSEMDWLILSAVSLMLGFLLPAVMMDIGKTSLLLRVITLFALLMFIFALIPMGGVDMQPFMLANYVVIGALEFCIVAAPMILQPRTRSHFVISLGVAAFCLLELLSAATDGLPADWLESALGRWLISGCILLLLAAFIMLMYVRRGDEAPAAVDNGAATAPYDPPVEQHLERLGLTRREREVAALLIRGRSRSEIESELGISASTVNTYCWRVFSKSGCRNQADLISAYYIRRSE